MNTLTKAGKPKPDYFMDQNQNSQSAIQIQIVICSAIC